MVNLLTKTNFYEFFLLSTNLDPLTVNELLNTYKIIALYTWIYLHLKVLIVEFCAFKNSK